jgi:hypothetical protein
VVGAPGRRQAAGLLLLLLLMLLMLLMLMLLVRKRLGTLGRAQGRGPLLGSRGERK